MNRNASYNIAIFEFLKIREPIFVFSFIGIKLTPYGIWNLLKPERNIPSACAFSLQSSTPSTAKTEI